MMSSLVSVKISPVRNWIGSGLIFPRRIFGPGQVGHYGDTSSDLLRGCADARNHLAMVGEFPMRKIQPSDIESGAYQTLEHLR